MKALPLAASAALLMVTAGSVGAQSVQPPAIAQLRCSDIVNADAAYQAALVYYAAGYRDGSDYAMALNSTTANQASSALSAMASTTVAAAPASAAAAISTTTSSSAPAGMTNTTGSTSSAPTLGGLTLQAQDVIGACKSSPNALVTDIVANRGGGTGFNGTPGGTAAGAIAAPPAAVGTDATTGGAASGAASAASTGSAPAVSQDLQGASQQLQQSVTSNAPPAEAASSP